MRRIKQLLGDDDSAVSPVIGVILMVAITVILAAVIASFVLGLGDQADDVSPNIMFDSDFDNSSGNATLTVSTADGDADADTIYLRGDADGTAWAEENDDISAGASITIGPESDIGWEDEDNVDEIVIVFETDDTSDTIATIQAPDDFIGTEE